ncbi:DUF2007 domain-containing protein [Anaerolineae bacterium CFX9]|nr:DUF2007 domain-containing protein [Anaerolineae bacterium CFX9]
MSLIPPSHTPEGWMVVLVTYNPLEAHVVSGRLQSEGIQTWIYQESVGRSIGIQIGPLGEVKVLVHPDEYDRALTILNSDPDLPLLEDSDFQDPEDSLE